MTKQQIFINTIGPLYIKDYKKTKILPSIRTAMSILESGWGKSTLAQKACNYGGVKWDAYKTPEWFVMRGIKWAKFKSIEEFIVAQGEYFVSKPHYYKKLIGETNLYKALAALEESPYCEDKGYDQQLKTIILQYNLQELDKEALKPDLYIKALNDLSIYVSVSHLWNDDETMPIKKHGKDLIIKVCNGVYGTKFKVYEDAINYIATLVNIDSMDIWLDFDRVKPKHIKALIQKIANHKANQKFKYSED